MDARIAIWNTLHDGEITVVAREGADLVMFVSVPYIRERLKPLGDSFALRLGGFRGFELLDSDGKKRGSDIQVDLARNHIEILSTDSTAMPVKITTTHGYVVLDFDSLEIALDSGAIISYEEVLKACSEYWDEWSARIPKKEEPNQAAQTTPGLRPSVSDL
jgi:hypothetical protein